MEGKVQQIGNIMPSNTRDNANQGRVYNSQGLAPTLNTMGGGGRQPYIIECVCIGGLGEKKSNGGTQFYQQDRVYSMGDVAMCQPAQLVGGSYWYLDVQKVEHSD